LLIAYFSQKSADISAEEQPVEQFCKKHLVTKMTMLVIVRDERGSGRFECIS